eukprot:TRINITY_DN1301_c0_g3_i12.p1 TRINITY_DN1301_c0_g3~~TRINITY_DN1301_c0_g3_i12.p1  ORF type:complete len:141 (-),score=21.88 TRINITY_DN1301_c0_g3_i12:66-488(-)
MSQKRKRSSRISQADSKAILFAYTAYDGNWAKIDEDPTIKKLNIPSKKLKNHKTTSRAADNHREEIIDSIHNRNEIDTNPISFSLEDDETNNTTSQEKLNCRDKIIHTYDNALFSSSLSSTDIHSIDGFEDFVESFFFTA